MSELRDYPKSPKEGKELINALKNEGLLGNPYDLDRTQKGFDMYVRPALYNTVLRQDVDTYSALDHALFSSYIVAVEDQDWFKAAFHNVNEYGLILASKIKGEAIIAPEGSKLEKRLIMYIFKGQLVLAHSDFFVSYLSGLAPSGIEKHHSLVVLLDDPGHRVPKGIRYVSLAGIKSVREKLEAFSRLQIEHKPYNTVWVACIQNIALYMGASISLHNTYWTMKRHSVVFECIDRYSTLLSRHKNSVENGVYWFGGRSNIRFKRSSIGKAQSAQRYLGSKIQYWTEGDIVVYGALARQQKYHSIEYWDDVITLLKLNDRAIFLYGSQTLPSLIQTRIDSCDILSSRAINVGWLDGESQDAASIIDIYFDTAPFGSGVPAAEAIVQGSCYIGLINDINLEMSLINLLKEYAAKIGIHNDLAIGLSTESKIRLELALEVGRNKELRYAIAKLQHELVIAAERDSIHFSSDYFSFFSS